MKKIAIISAPNGARKQKTDHPAVPVTVDEIVQTVISCRDAGAAMAHVHARDSKGQHSLAIDDNHQLLEALTASVGDSIIIQLTTEAIGIYSPEQQRQLIKETSPPAASFALRELIPDDTHIPQAETFFAWAADQGMLAQYILYDRADVDRYLDLCRAGVLPEPGRHALLVLGRYHAQQLSEPTDLVPFLSDELIENERWGICAFGPKEAQCLTTAMLLGGDVRIGFENNLYSWDGALAENNASQVCKLVELASSLDIKLDSAGSMRKSL